MNRRTFLTSLGTAMLTIGAGCASDATEEDIMSELTDITRVEGDKNGGGFGGSFHTTRFIDRNAGVVLYSYTVSQGGGITAIPLSETNLE